GVSLFAVGIIGLLFLLSRDADKSAGSAYVRHPETSPYGTSKESAQEPTEGGGAVAQPKPELLGVKPKRDVSGIKSEEPKDTPAWIRQKQQEEALKREQELVKQQKERESAELQAKRQAEMEKQNVLKPKQEEQQISVIEQKTFNDLKPQVYQEIGKYNYSAAVTRLTDFINRVKIATIKEDASHILSEVKEEHLFFIKMVMECSNQTPRKKIVIGSMKIVITKATESGFEGFVEGLSGSTYSRRWVDVPVVSILELFSKDLAKSERFAMATFCYHHNLPFEGERNLISCYKAYPDLKEQLDRFLSRYKNIPLPAGGFFEYKGQLVTAEEKSYLEKGYVKYQGKWMSYDEMMVAKGYVKFQEKWVTPQEKEKLEAGLKKIADLQKRLTPKGIIDKPGADKEKLPWDKALVKETEHYIIKANLSQEAIDDLCYVMECFYFEAKKIFKLARDPGSKLKVFVFKEASEYYANGGAGGSQGVYMSSGANKQIMTYYQPPRTISVLLHEGTHQFVDLVCNARVPIWINEGLATYYESSKFEGDSLKTNIVNHERLRLIKDLIIKKDVPRLEDIINIRQANFAIYEYAHTWSLVYFFMNYNKGQYADELEEYFEKIKKKGFENRPQHKQLFEESFKIKFETLEKEWEEYIVKLN
ncbi:MAG: DUF1570 domain-containing protein, partial [Planctomycetota bacterium]|nr:DUF1570 domain-containing protein [Planctomycetota bacterium]